MVPDVLDVMRALCHEQTFEFALKELSRPSRVRPR